MDELATSPCRMIPWEQRSGAMNMALDVVAARRATEKGVGTVRTYGWEPSTLSLGYAQAAETVAWEACREMGIEITRRPTGGGGILHESWGDVSYSVVLPAEDLPSDLMSAYRQLCQPVIAAFTDLGLDVAFAETERPALHEPSCYLRDIHPAHDLVVSVDGVSKKISGNAQYRQRDAVIQHGSLRFDYDPERMLACFTDADPGIAAVRERVGSMAACGVEDRDTVIETLETTLATAFDTEPAEWTPAEEQEGRDLVREQFGHERWIRDREEPSATAD